MIESSVGIRITANKVLQNFISTFYVFQKLKNKSKKGTGGGIKERKYYSHKIVFTKYVESVKN